MKTNLFIIDAQNSFCSPNGSLFVPGADKDMERLSSLILKNYKDIDSIKLTMDSHHKVHIAHPIFWADSKGNHPDPFTLISAEDVRKGVWKSYNPGFQKRALDYVETLEKNGRYVLCIWPPHCIIGSEGHGIYLELFDSVMKWEDQFDIASIITKGSNPFTEHYSAVQADVPDPSDYTTGLNSKLIEELKNIDNNDRLLIAGEALSHCVANTMRDIIAEFDLEEAKKVTILEDCCSSVPGFEKLGEDFLKDMVNVGVKVTTSDKIF